MRLHADVVKESECYWFFGSCVSSYPCSRYDSCSATFRIKVAYGLEEQVFSTFPVITRY
jgi:hypothetical protein